MTHEYGDPICPEGIEAAVRLTLELRQRTPDVPVRDLADIAVRRSVCACVVEIEDQIEHGVSGTHAALIEEVTRRTSDAEGGAHAKGPTMSDIYAHSTPKLQARRRELAPEQLSAFHEFSRKVFAEGALSAKLKQLVAVAVAHTTQCPYCIRGHTEAAVKAGASDEEIMEAIWVAAEMRAGAAYAHSTIALDALEKLRA